MSVPGASAEDFPPEDAQVDLREGDSGGGVVAEDGGVKLAAGGGGRLVAGLAEDFAQHGIGEGIRFHAAGRGDEQGAVNIEDDGAEAWPGRGCGLQRGEQEMELIRERGGR